MARDEVRDWQGTGAGLMQRKRQQPPRRAHLLPAWAQQLFIICAMCQGIRFERAAELGTYSLFYFFFSNLHSQKQLPPKPIAAHLRYRLLHTNSHDTGRKFKQQKKSSKLVAFDKAGRRRLSQRGLCHMRDSRLCVVAAGGGSCGPRSNRTWRRD